MYKRQIRIVFAPRSEHPFIFLSFADCVLFSPKSVRKKRINKRNFINYALGNVDILSVAHDSELGWFSSSFDDDEDRLIVEDDDEDDDG